jgi:hypothetical protein
MGTDIHMYVERRDNGEWKLVAPPPAPPKSERTKTRKDRGGKEYEYVSPFWGPYGCMYDRGPPDVDDDPEYARLSRMHWYRNRNYDVFAILTGTVRNGVGFAGCDMGDGFHGIVSEPRGVRAVGSWTAHASWDHSEGWLLLSEILAFNWDQVTRKRGVIPLRPGTDQSDRSDTNYVSWRANKGAPKSYCGDVAGPSIRVVTESEADRILGAPPDLNRYYVRVQWTETYREAAEDFLAFVNQMLVPLGDATDTRLVFGFDS